MIDDPQIAFLLAWFRAFLLTQAVELVVHANARGLSFPLRQRLAIGFAASAMTHPMVWFVIPPLVTRLVDFGDYQTDYWAAVVVAEAFAFTAEALWLRAFGVKTLDAFATSTVANAWSFTIGLFLYRVVHW